MDEKEVLRIIAQKNVKKHKVDVNDVKLKKVKLRNFVDTRFNETRIKNLVKYGFLEQDAILFNKKVAVYILRNLKDEELAFRLLDEYGNIGEKCAIEFLYKKYKELFNKAVEHYTEYEDVQVLKKNVIKFPFGRYVKEDETGSCLILPSEAYEIKKKLRFRPNVKAMTTRDKLKFVEYYLNIDTSTSTRMLVNAFIRRI